MTSSLSFLVADDHPLFRDAMRGVLSSGFPNATIHVAGDLASAIQSLEDSDDVDLVLLDLNMPGIQGFSGLIFLRGQYPGVPVVIVSASEDNDTIRRSISLGASGFLPKSLGTDKMIEAIQDVMEGKVWVPNASVFQENSEDELLEIGAKLSTLTPQQMRVLMMLKEGLLNKQIAYELSVSEATIKAHVSAILQKLDVNSRTQAVIVASKIGETEHAA